MDALAIINKYYPEDNELKTKYIFLYCLFFICICAASRVSNRWVSPTLEVWFTTNATRFPFNIGKRRPICSAPVITFCAVTALQINKRQYRKRYPHGNTHPVPLR